MSCYRSNPCPWKYQITYGTLIPKAETQENRIESAFHIVVTPVPRTAGRRCRTAKDLAHSVPDGRRQGRGWRNRAPFAAPVGRDPTPWSIVLDPLW
jgi:hypothetical protein